jgi:hypothetical protein
MSAVHDANAARLRAIIATHGWAHGTSGWTHRGHSPNL